MIEPSEKLRLFEKRAIILLPIFYLVGTVSHGIESLLPFMITLTPYTILGTAVIGFAPFVVLKHTKLLVWALVTFLITLFLEILGVKTGLVFGEYDYGATLGFEFMEVPLLIGINWTLIILGSIKLVEKISDNTWAVMAMTAAVTVIFDYIMEPAAIALDYWSWEGGPIPLQNYIAWGVISFVFAGLYRLMKLENPSRLPSAIVIIQGVFFLALRFLVV